MEAEFFVGSSKIRLVRGDITDQDTEAVVNAANSSLMGGGGVDGAIHRAGGPAILEECRRIVEEKGRCPTGQAVITTGGRLKARHVIHAVGPVWRGGGQGEDESLAEAYRNSLALAEREGIRTISFPSLSTGAFRFPVGRAARIALKTVRDFIADKPFKEVRFVLFSPGDFDTYRQAAEEIMGGQGGCKGI